MPTTMPTQVAANPLAFALTAPVTTQSHALQTLSVDDVRKELAEARRVGSIVRDGFASATHGIDGFTPTAAQRFTTSRGYDATFSTWAIGLVGGVIAGVVAGGLTSHFYTESLSPYVGGAVFVASLGLSGLVSLVAGVAASIGEKQGARRVAPRDIDATLTKLQSHAGFTRAVSTGYITQWRTALDEAKVLTPEARDVLLAVEGTMPPEERQRFVRARALQDAAVIMDGADKVTIHTVRKLESAIASLPLHEQKEVATIAEAVIRASSRVKDYDAEHALHDLPKKLAQPATQAAAA